jgi:hypothetical protein
MNSITVKDAGGDEVAIAARPAPLALSLSAETPNPEGCDVQFYDSGLDAWRPPVESDFVINPGFYPAFRFPMLTAGFDRFTLAIGGAIDDGGGGKPKLVGGEVYPGDAAGQFYAHAGYTPSAVGTLESLALLLAADGGHIIEAMTPFVNVSVVYSEPDAIISGTYRFDLYRR